MSVLAMLAEHNAWANARLFAACAAVPAARLTEEQDGYDSVLGILQHLVQVEHNFFALAYRRERMSALPATLADAAEFCARIDDDATARIRGFRSRGTNAKPRRDSKQCLACVRGSARKRRIERKRMSAG